MQINYFLLWRSKSALTFSWRTSIEVCIFANTITKPTNPKAIGHNVLIMSNMSIDSIVFPLYNIYRWSTIWHMLLFDSQSFNSSSIVYSFGKLLILRNAYRCLLFSIVASASVHFKAIHMVLYIFLAWVFYSYRYFSNG